MDQENSRAYYIIQQYLAATGCLKQQQQQRMGSDTMMVKKNMYTTGVVKMICCETEICSGNGKGVKSIGTRSIGENGCFVLWQMNPGMWSLELVLGTTNTATAGALHNNNNKVIAGSNGKIVWRHTPWLGTHAAKGPLRPLRRLIQVLILFPSFPSLSLSLIAEIVIYIPFFCHSHFTSCCREKKYKI